MSRSLHFMGPLALKSDTLQPNFHSALMHLSTQLDSELWTEYVNSLWAIWRCQNDRVYGGKEAGLMEFKQYFGRISWESQLIAKKGGSPLTGRDAGQVLNTDTFEFCCHVDGSWSQGWEGGIGVVLEKKGELIFYKSVKARACCPVQSEAMALKMALELVIQRGITSCCFLSDSKGLVELVSESSPPLNADWRAFPQVFSVWTSLQASASLSCQHIPRSENALSDGLAKLGRVQGWDLIGFTFPVFSGF